MEKRADNTFLKSHPGMAIAAAIAMVVLPLGGMATSNMISNAAEVPFGDDFFASAYLDNEDYVKNSSFPVRDRLSADSPIQMDAGNDEPSVMVSSDKDYGTDDGDKAGEKSARFTVIGSGHIEPVENCLIDGASGRLWFSDIQKDAKFKIVADDGSTTGTVDSDSDLSIDGSTVTLFHDIDYDITVRFSGQASSDNNGNQAAQQEQSEEFVYYYQEQPSEVYDSPVVSYQRTEPSYPVNVRPADEGQFSIPTPSVAQHRMNDKELALAMDIFNAYNDFRASKGLPRMAWDETCTNIAYASATGCASRDALIHDLGIPEEVNNYYSDILQYSTWKMTAAEAVKNWEESAGHRKQMQCEGAQTAGVGVYKNTNGKWYYVIAYSFEGCNQSGN